MDAFISWGFLPMKKAVSAACIQDRRGSEPAIPLGVSCNLLLLYPTVSKVFSFLFRSSGLHVWEAP